MESIEIKGFLTIDYAHFEIKKINILIGEQAQGKSVVVKLIYLFKSFFKDFFLKSVEKFESKKDICKQFLLRFEQIFPRYSWTNQEFSIFYRYEDYDISIVSTKSDGRRYVLIFKYCDKLDRFHKELKFYYKSLEFDIDFDNEQTKKDKFYKKITDSEFGSLFEESIFIPAGRSFFPNLQINVFSFLVNDIDIDTFLKEFGSKYEQSKRFYQKILENFNTEDCSKKINSFASSIIVGEYFHTDGQDWILNNGKKTNLANASSGQQESLPMLLVLKTFPFIYGKQRNANFFVEEPEAHLFPTSQKQIISLIATIYNTFGHSFFITTHSPYILTAINNLVVGKDAYDKADGNTEILKRLEQVFAFDELINLEDVSAYTLNKGKLESIINMENRLIGANLLDAVSDEFDEAFGVATDILYGDE